jgi:prevent-host-death family protein
MSVKVTVRQLQEQLPELLDRAVERGEECIVQRNGKAVAVLVSLCEWQRIKDDTHAAAVKEQERRVRAYQKQMKQLGADYWLPPEQQVRLKALVEKEDFGVQLTREEQTELRQLLKRHEQLMVKRAAAMQTRR